MAISASSEIEAKFRVGDQRTQNSLQNRKTLGSHHQVGPATAVDVTDVYVDTKDARLLRAGYSLRVRHRNDHPLVTLKALHAWAPQAKSQTPSLHIRHELEQTLLGPQLLITAGTAFRAKRLPEDILAVVDGIITKKSKLRPLCMIKQTRHERLVYPQRSANGARENAQPGAANPDDGSSDHVALLSIDQVAVYAGSARIDNHARPVTTFVELEAELRPGLEEAELTPICGFLAALDGLVPEPESKFVRALIALSQTLPSAASPADGEIHSTTPMAEALRLVWRKQHMQLLLLEAGIRRDDDIEYVHAMRVAIRRLRSAHLLLGHFFQPAVIEPLVSGLQRTAKVLGKVRDLDVALEKLAGYEKRLDAEARPELQPLVDYWQQQRAHRFGELLDWFGGKPYDRLMAAMHPFVTTPGLGVQKRYTEFRQPPEASQVRHVLPTMLLDRFLAVRKYETLFDARSAANGSEPVQVIELSTLHALRIECKYLRYALEITPALLGQEGQDFIKQLRKLQNLLGNLNDASVAKEMLSALPAEVRTKAVKRYAKRQDKLIHKAEQRVDRALRTFLADENRIRLGQMVGRI